MNNKLISKVIKFDNKTCPDFVYDNPLLDKSIARSVAKSFVKMLKTINNSTQESNNLRMCIVENIRKSCKVDVPNHRHTDDNVLSALLEFYETYLRTNPHDEVHRSLDAFLIHRMKDLEVSGNVKSKLNPELAQALLNLNCTGLCIDKITEEAVQWNSKSNKDINLIKELWSSGDVLENYKLIGDLSLKMKEDIEKTLLEASLNLLNNKDIDIYEYCKSNETLQRLIKICSHSSNCFQMCTEILNAILIRMDFDPITLKIVYTFVKHVQSMLAPESFIGLYPIHLSSLIILLDTDLDSLPIDFREIFIKDTCHYLRKLQQNSEHDFILVLSHFPQWFDVYFSPSLS